MTEEPIFATVTESPIQVHIGKVRERITTISGGHFTNIMEHIPAEEQAAIRNRTSTYDATAAINAAIVAADVLYFPPGSYNIQSDQGDILGSHGVRVLSNKTILGHATAELLVKDGAPGLPFLARGASNILLDTVRIFDQRTDPTGGVGFMFENVSGLRVRYCTVDGFPLYGIGVSDDTSGEFYRASTISYDGTTNTIYDDANELGRFDPGMRVGISGSLFNNQIVTIVDVAGDGSWMTTVESLVTEAAGQSKSYIESNTVSFDGTTNIISAEVSLAPFNEGSDVVISGSAMNDDTYGVVSLGEGGNSITVDGTLITEAAGAIVTITKVGRSALMEMRAEACDDIVLEFNNILNIGRIGIEIFPKVTSRHLRVVGNYVYNCGHDITGGCGIKASQAFLDAEVTGNWVHHCQIGMIFQVWESSVAERNIVTNAAKMGIAIGISDHMRYAAGMEMLMVRNNVLAYILDAATGARYVSPYAGSGYRAININGVDLLIGHIHIAQNSIQNWTGGIGSSAVLRAHPNIHVYDNEEVDSGNSIFVPVISTGDVVSGSNEVTNIKIGTTLSVGGWAIGADFNSDYHPDGTTVIDVDGPGKRLVVSNNATGNKTGAELYSAYLEGLEWYNNKQTNNDPTRNITTTLYSNNIKVVGNIQDGAGAYGLTVGGSGLIKNHRAINPNPTNVPNRGIILLATGGDWNLDDVYADVTKNPASLVFMVNNTKAPNAKFTNVRASDARVRILFNLTNPIATGYVVASYGGNRHTFGNRAPSDLTIHRFQGDKHYNSEPTVIYGIDHWKCISTGTTGQVWRAEGMGYGTTTDRNTLTWLGAFDAGFQFDNTTTGTIQVWNGSAWTH